MTTHQFYVTIPNPVPVYNVQYFNVDDASKDKNYQTVDPMQIIYNVTKGEEFYYQFDITPTQAHCIIAHYEGDTMIISSDEIRTTTPGSDALTEILHKRI